MVNNLKKKMSEVFLRAREVLGAMAELRQEKVNLEVRLLSRLEELRKAWDEGLTFKRRFQRPNRKSLRFGNRSCREAGAQAQSSGTGEKLGASREGCGGNEGRGFASIEAL